MHLHDGDAEKQCGVEIKGRMNRNGGMSRLAVALIIQSLLTTLCLAISTYSLMGTVQSVGKDIGIYLEVMGEVKNQMDKLNFNVYWKHKMELDEGNTISFQCSGPYVVHVSACSVDMGNPNSTLILQQPGIDRMIIPLQSQDDCEGENFLKSQKGQWMLSFNKHDNVSVRFTSKSVTLSHLHLGFHYLLGEQCFGRT